MGELKVNNKTYHDSNSIVWHAAIDNGGFTCRGNSYMACHAEGGKLCVCPLKCGVQLPVLNAEEGWPIKYRKMVIDAIVNGVFDDPFAKYSPPGCEDTRAWLIGGDE